MFKLSDSLSWLLLASATGALSMIRLNAGDMPLPAMTVCVAAVSCALHRPTRELVVRGLLRLVSGSTIRFLIIVFGAVMLIQLLPLELGLLLAGDVLVYLEAVAAVSLIAANARLKPWLTVARVRLLSRILLVRDHIGRPSRQPRVQRPTPPSGSSDDPDRRAWAFA